MAKHLRKAIMDRLRCKHRYLKFPSRENFLAMKSMKNKCNSLCKKVKTQYFKKCASKNSSNNKQFWDLVNPFLTNKSSLSSDSITIKDKDRFFNDEKELVEIFNNYYKNNVEKTSGKLVENSFENCDNNFEAVLKIIKKYEKHQSILEIRKNLKLTETFRIPKAEVSDINKLLKNINIKKATGFDTNTPGSANIVDSHLSNVIYKDLESNSFSDGEK